MQGIAVSDDIALRQFEHDKARYLEMGGRIDSEKMRYDHGDNFATDFQYILMDRWALDKVLAQKPEMVYDFGSQLQFVSLLSAIIPVTHYDIRDPLLYLDNLKFCRADILHIPLPQDAGQRIDCVTCLHVAEHIGLGRYGDDIDPAGFTKACSELARILSPGGNLFFSVPIGKAGTVFNVHRILDTLGVIDAFPEIEMIEFSIIGMES